MVYSLPNSSRKLKLAYVSENFAALSVLFAQLRNFSQNWVFRGSCWDLTGEFMLRVNPKNHGRRDRRRWTSYIEAAAPDDVKSCVPSFLSPVAMDILTSGKTIELMQLVCPEV